MIGKIVFLWSSKKQTIFALSTCEAEYVAAATSAFQSVWLSNIMNQIGFNLDVPIKIYVDNVSAINLAKNLVFHQRSKHIDIRYHYLQDQVRKNMIIFLLEDRCFHQVKRSVGHEGCSKSELREDVGY